ncbi:hypothetical protein BJV74DRAFT_209809 [Russula compacta]|nr:hypothetical protein BJV74DRAFT_209809 [Russula compacta]
MGVPYRIIGTYAARTARLRYARTRARVLYPPLDAPEAKATGGRAKGNLRRAKPSIIRNLILLIPIPVLCPPLSFVLVVSTRIVHRLRHGFAKSHHFLEKVAEMERAQGKAGGVLWTRRLGWGGRALLGLASSRSPTDGRGYSLGGHFFPYFGIRKEPASPPAG